jgi:hypothetical protein
LDRPKLNKKLYSSIKNATTVSTFTEGNEEFLVVCGIQDNGRERPREAL